MSDYQTMNDVLAQLAAEGYIDAVPEEAPFNTDDDTPIYIKGLMGFGGWIAALFFFLFAGFCIISFFASVSSDQTFGAILAVMGGIFIIATIMMQRSGNNNGTFIAQILLAFHIAGHTLVLVGSSLFITYQWQAIILVATIFIALQLIVIPLFKDGTYRFLATIGCVIALNVIVYELQIPGSLSVLIGLLALGAVVVWGDMLPVTMQIRYRPLLLSVGYGLVFGLFGTIAHELSNSPDYSTIAQMALHKPFITSLILLVITIWYEVKVLGDYDRPPLHPSSIVLIGLTIIITIPTLTTAGIIAAILLILLGYRRKHNLLLVVAYLFMAGFIGYYYYSLQTTLLVKSFILMGTGILFLAGGLSLRRLLPVSTSEEA